jgi:hypothetical protein
VHQMRVRMILEELALKSVSTYNLHLRFLKLLCKVQNQFYFLCINNLNRLFAETKVPYLHLSSSFWIKGVASRTIWYNTPSFLESTLNTSDFNLFSTWSYPKKILYFLQLNFPIIVETSDAARERDFCSCIALSKPASSKLKPLSLNIKAVKSIGKPKVSYNSNALAPFTSLYR